MANNMILNEQTFFGNDEIKIVNELLKSNNDDRILFISNSKDKQNIINKIKNIKIIEHVVDCEENIYDIYERIIELINKEKIKFVVCCGKRNLINIGKLISNLNKNIHAILIPTEELWFSSKTYNYYQLDEKTMRYSFGDNTLYKNMSVIIDYNLIKEMPKQELLENCIDTLYMSIENYNDDDSWLMKDIFNINSCSLLCKNVTKILNNSKFSLEEIACSLFLCGAGTINSQNFSLMTKLALELYCKDISDDVFKIVFPYYIKYKLQRNKSIINNLTKALSIEFDEKDCIEMIIRKINLFNKSIGLPKKLSNINFPKELIPTIAKQIINNMNSSNQKININEEEIIDIFKSAY